MEEYITLLPFFDVGSFFLCFCGKKDERCEFCKKCRESSLELLQRYRRDRKILLDFILSGSLIKKVVMPPGAVTLDDVDLDQVSVDYVLNCAKKGGNRVHFS